MFRVLLISVFFTCFVAGSSAQLSEATVKAGLLFRLGESISWPDEEKIDIFRFGILTGDSALITELKKVTRIKKLRDKPIKIFVNDEISGYYQLQGVFIDSDHLNSLNGIVKQTKGKRGILIITYNSHELLLSMINIYKDENESSLRFKINKQSLDENGFKYKHDLLLYGGNLMDVKDLFISTNEQLTTKNSEIDSMTKALEVLKDESAYYSNQIRGLSDQMRLILERVGEREKDVVALSNDINRKDSSLNLLNRELLAQRNNKELLAIQLKNKIDSISLAEENLSRLNAQLEEKKKQVSESKAVITSQSVKIKEQEKGLFWAVIIGVILLAIVTTVVIALIIKKQLAEKLSAQKEELLATLTKLNDTQKQLVESEKLASLGMLTAGIAHEINNPINFISSGNQALEMILEELWEKIEELSPDSSSSAKELAGQIQGFLDSVERGGYRETIKEVVANIQMGVTRTSEIINSLRTYTRRSDSEEMFVSVNNSIDEALVMLKHKYKYRVEIKKELGEIPEITALPGKLNQVFVNVLSNAFDAIVDKGVVNISTRYRSEMSLIEIVVEDNGKGIEKEDVDKIFDPFFTTKDPGSGIGLGMYISYGIVSQLGGTIKIDSERGRGTTIEITLPVSDNS